MAEEFNEIKKLIFIGELPLAEKRLQSLHAATPQDEKTRRHQLAIIQMRNGRFAEAADHLTQTIQSYDGHISLWLDLATCQYASGQIFNWQQSLKRSEYEFQSSFDRLSLKQKVDYIILIAKFKEEQGSIAKALDYYGQSLKLCKNHGDAHFQNQRLHALAQSVRLQAQYHLPLSSAEPYQDLLSLSQDQTNLEAQHALLISEVQNFNSRQAWDRLAQIQTPDFFQSPESSMILTDFIYELLLQKKEVPTELQQLMTQFSHLSTFEKSVLEASQNQPFSLSDLDGWSQQMMPAHYLRRLILGLKQGFYLEEIKTRLLFSVQNYATADRQAWMNFIRSEMTHKNRPLVYDALNQSLYFNGEIFCLQTKPAYRELIEMLLTQSEIPCLQVVQKLWNRENNQANISRLKMRIQRFNREISQRWVISNLVSIQGDKLTLTRQITRRMSS